MTFSGQFNIWRSSFIYVFSEQSLFCSYYFRVASFSERNFYRAHIYCKQEVIQGSYLSKQLSFCPRNCLEKKRSKEDILFQSRYFCTSSLLEKSYILENANNSEKQYSQLPTFSKDAAFYRIYLLRRIAFLEHTFSEKLIFHSYASFPRPRYLFIC